ncbi:hypothetical protein A33M_1124 [Rhodovulum sp. PH10]|nr:hypothetical protein A33M_1124 [Rhodovulum sp. PH10]
MRLSGSADLRLGAVPRLDLTVLGRQLDLDRLLAAAGPEAKRAPAHHSAAPGSPAPRSPAVALPAALSALFGPLVPPVPTRASVAIDTLTVGGGTIQDFRAGLVQAGDDWRLDGVEMRAPGLAHIRVDGRLSQVAGTLGFTGPVSVEAADPKTFLAWVEGRPDAAPAAMGALEAKGDVTIDRSRVAVVGLSAAIDRRTVTGRFAYMFAGSDGPARLDAALTAGEIDLADLLSLAGGSLADLGWPRHVALAFTADRAVLGPVTAGKVDTELTVDGRGLTVERLSIGDLRGATVSAHGRIDLSADPPDGQLTLALKAPRSDGLMALAADLLPGPAGAIRRYAGPLGDADLSATLAVGPAEKGAGGPARATLAVDGKVGVVKVALSASGTGDPAAPAAARVSLEGTVEASDGTALAALTGLDRVFTLDARPASIGLTGKGRLDRELSGDVRIASGGLWASAAATAQRAKGEWTGKADLSVTASDAGGLAPGAGPLPLAVKSRMALAEDTLKIEEFAGKIGGAGVSGTLAYGLSTPHAISGRVSAGTIDAAPVLAALLGVGGRYGRDATPSPWSAEPFVRPLFPDLVGELAVSADRALLLPGLEAQQMSGKAVFDGTSLVLDGLGGRLAGGRFAGRLAMRRADVGLSVGGRLSLASADLFSLLPEQVRGSADAPLARGKTTLSVEAEGSGLSPAALVGSLRGRGSLTVENARIAGLAPGAIAGGIRAVDQGLPLERLAGWLDPAFAAGSLDVAKAAGPIAIGDGRVRLGPMAATTDGTDVTLTAAYDLAADRLDARFALTGPAPGDAADGKRPEAAVALHGPLAAPTREVDTAALVSFVTLRSVEREAERLEAAEREAKRRDAAEAARIARERERLKEKLARERLAAERLAAERSEAAERARAAAAAKAAGGATTDGPADGPAGGSSPSARVDSNRADRASDRTGTTAAPRAPTLPPPIEIRPQTVRPVPDGAMSGGAGARSHGAPPPPGDRPSAMAEPPERGAAAGRSPDPPAKSIWNLFNLR